MSREAMTVVYWTKPEKRRDAEGTWADTGGQVTTRVHVSRDAESCVCGPAIPSDATIVAVTADWHELTTCYNCAYRLWPDHAPPGYVRPCNSQDFPPRRECPHEPGNGRDPTSCRTCTPSSGLVSVDPALVAGETADREPAETLPRWTIPTPYAVARCGTCGLPISAGELISIEYQAGVVHARCPSDTSS